MPRNWESTIDLQVGKWLATGQLERQKLHRKGGRADSFIHAAYVYFEYKAVQLLLIESILPRRKVSRGKVEKR